MSSAYPNDVDDPHRGLRARVPRHGDGHDQADGRDRRGRGRPRRHVADRLRGAGRRRGARRQALLRHVRPAEQPARAPARQPRQAALLRRQGHPGDLLAGAARRRHGADHGRRPHRPGRRRIALRPRHPPAPQARRAVPVRHRPGGARHGHGAVVLQRPRVPHDLPRRDRDGALARPAELGLRRHERRPGSRRPGRHGGRRAHPAGHDGRLQPEPRRRLPRLRHDRRARADRHRRRVRAR